MMPFRKINSRYEGSDVLALVLEATEGGCGMGCDIGKPRNSKVGAEILVPRGGADGGRRISERVVDGGSGGAVFGRGGSGSSDSQ